MKNRIFDYLPTVGHRKAATKLDLSELGDITQRNLARAVKEIEAYVIKSPGVSLGVAISLGVVLGWWIKRR